MFKIWRNTLVVFLILIIVNMEMVASTQILSKNQINNDDVAVCVSENTILNVGGSGSDNYSSIQYAINLSNDGDIVFVWAASSPYFENIIIDKKIFLIGENKNNTIIDGRGIDTVLEIHHDGVTISGFTIKNSKKEWSNAGIVLFSDKNYIHDNIIMNTENGIYSYGLEDTIIENNIISKCENSGINISFSTNNTIKYNTFLNCDNFGIFTYDSLYNTVTDNFMNTVGVGVHLWYSFYNNISKNSIINTNTGLSFKFYSKNNTIINNIIKDSIDCGIELNFSFFNSLKNNVVENTNVGYKLFYSNENYIENNNIVSDCITGFDVIYSPDNIISGNTIKNNSYGIKFFSSSGNVIEHNFILGNTEIGLFFTDMNKNNRIYYNDFISNTKNAFFTNSVSNHWNQNYWDDWAGIGFYMIDGVFTFSEKSFHIPWVNIDFSPRDNPY